MKKIFACMLMFCFIATLVFAQAAPVNSTRYKIKVIQQEGGRISPSYATVKAGSNKTFMIKPKKDYIIQDVLVDNKSVGAVTKYTFTKVAGNHEIKAIFKEPAIKFTWSVDEKSMQRTIVNHPFNILIDWGDGNIGNTNDIPVVCHKYDKIGSYEVKVYTIHEQGINMIDCSGQNVKKLEISKNVKINRLNFSNNNITSLKCYNKYLQSLSCFNNKLTTLNISGDNLEFLNCSQNKLRTLNCAGKNLKSLDCSNNNLRQLNCSGNKLEELDCSGNKLVKLDCRQREGTKMKVILTDNKIKNIKKDSNTSIITVTQSPNGKISYYGKEDGDYSDMTEFNIKANKGYEIESIIVDGVAVKVKDSKEDYYFFEDFTVNHSLTATFVPVTEKYIITFDTTWENYKIDSIECAVGEEITLPDIDIKKMQEKSWAIIGVYWAGEDGKKYGVGEKYTPTKDTIFTVGAYYGGYRPVEPPEIMIKCIITFDTTFEDYKIDPIQCTVGKEITLPDIDIKKMQEKNSLILSVYWEGEDGEKYGVGEKYTPTKDTEFKVGAYYGGYVSPEPSQIIEIEPIEL